MLNLNSLLVTYPDWLVNMVDIFGYVALGIIFACAIVIILTTLFQNNSNDEAAFLSGGATESYYAKNKSGTIVGKLKVITIVCAIMIAFFAIFYFVFPKIVYGIYAG